MSRLLAVAAGLLTLAAASAEAHAHLKSSDPKEGAEVTQMPAAISLTFSESARITAVAIRRNQEPKQALPAPATVGETISVAVPTLAPGAYTLSWRVLSTDDNHIMSGELHFKVVPMNSAH
jgi:methionine-rich copper-binding protein CopC